MGTEANKSAFDRLVAGLSSDERQNLLRKLNATSNPVEFAESTVGLGEFSGTLKLRMDKESIFYRILLWFRSFLSKKDLLQVYNEDVLLRLGRKINREHPGVLDAKNQLLDSIFFDLLKNMKDAADFFKPYVLQINEDPGAFYVFLSSFIAPEIADEINAAVDPFNLPEKAAPTHEQKLELLHKMDDLHKNMKGDPRAALYQAVQTANWISDFSVLPFIHFLAQFSDIRAGVYTCTFKQAKVDFEAFARVFDYKVCISNEVLESMFLFSQRKEITRSHFDEDVENAVRAFLKKAQASLVSVKTFLSVCPVSLMGKVINQNYDWTAPNWGGSEDWFARYKNQWRKILDIRWTQWLREKKKETLALSLEKDFGLSSFPQMEHRPWTKLWGGVPFGCELTGGFLYWFFTEEFDFLMATLNILAMEGVFQKNENRTEFSENLSDFFQVGNKMLALFSKLEPKGEIGETFAKLMSENSVRSFQTQQTIESVIANIESEIRSAVKLTGISIRNMEPIFKGIYEEEKDGVHYGLQNLGTIKGHDNIVFREDLRKAREILRQTLYYLRELEPIENK